MDGFVARQARRAQRHHGRFDWLARTKLILFPNLKEPQISLVVIQIPFERRKHAHHAARTHHGSILSERVTDYGRRYPCGTEQFVAPRIDERYFDNLLIP